MAAITSLVIVVVIMAPLPPLTLATILASLLANQLGAIAPDIDQPTAPFWRNVSFGKIFGPAATRLLGGPQIPDSFDCGCRARWLVMWVSFAVFAADTATCTDRICLVGVYNWNGKPSYHG